MPEREILFSSKETEAQRKVVADLYKKYTVVGRFTESSGPGRTFVWLDDGISTGGIDNSTHEVQIFRDGRMIGELPGDES